MKFKLFTPKTTPPTTPNKQNKYPHAKTGKQLLTTTDRACHLLKIKRLYSVTERIWEDHYKYAIEQFAELVQQVPASEIHHHSNHGGLIDHTLEALHAGTRIAQGYILPPNSEPEEISSSSDRWRFGAFIAILAHDLGKIVTDIEIVYRQKNTDFQPWHPWYGNIPLGAEYSYRYKQRANNSKLAKSLHEKATMSLLPRLLTHKAAHWIFEDVELLAQLFSTVSHATLGGQVIAEIVRAADQSSVSNNLGATTGVNTDHSASVPLQEKLIISLRNLVNDGELKRNKPGAAIWVTDEYTWAVSKATMEAVRIQLTSEGHKGIPKNVVRLFEILKDHELIQPNPEGESVWTAEVNDFAKNWQQKLTFLCFKNEVIWPTSNPDKFDGEINPIDKEGSAAEPPTVKNQVKKKKTEVEATATKNKKNNTQGYSPPDQLKLQKKEPTPTNTNIDQIPAIKPSQPAKQTALPIAAENTSLVSSADVKVQWENSPKAHLDRVEKNEFISWLISGISRRQIRVNEAKAPVHILEKYVALVTPVIFNLYLEKNSLRKKIYENRAGDSKVYTLVQRELEALDIHQRGQNGQNIVKVGVEGAKRKSELKVYLLRRECFPTLSNFHPNSAVKIDNYR